MKLIIRDINGKVYFEKENPTLPLTLGRDATNDICIPNPGISRTHALIELINDAIYVVDHESVNGISFDGQRFEKIQVEKELIVALGSTKLVIEIQGKVATSADENTRALSGASKPELGTHPANSQTGLFSADAEKTRVGQAHISRLIPDVSHDKTQVGPLQTLQVPHLDRNRELSKEPTSPSIKISELKNPQSKLQDLYHPITSETASERPAETSSVAARQKQAQQPTEIRPSGFWIFVDEFIERASRVSPSIWSGIGIAALMVLFFSSSWPAKVSNFVKKSYTTEELIVLVDHELSKSDP